MPRLTGTTRRAIRTLIAGETAGSGKTTVRRVTATVAGISQAIPSNINFCVIKNTGAVVVTVNFGSDGATDFWTLAAGAVSPTIGLGEGVVIKAKTASSTAILEVLFWG